MKASIAMLMAETYYFVDKCLPFGASISHAHISKDLAMLSSTLCNGELKKALVNYMDDYFFALLMKMVCNNQVNESF